MGIFAIALSSVIGAALLLPGCARFELETTEERSSQSVRVTAEDSVVLCPLSATTESSGAVAVVWAGYPPADDRLQLMHTRISPQGEVLRTPRPIAFLDDELDALRIRRRGEGLEVQLLEHEARETVAIEISESGTVIGGHNLPVDTSWSGESCEVELNTAAARLQIFQGHVDGEMPLFVHARPL